MRKHRVVVTGISLISPIGTSISEFWHKAINGHSGVRLVDWFDIPDDMSRIAGVASMFKPETIDCIRTVSAIDRVLLFALKATHDALINAGLDESSFNRLDLNRCAIFFSSAVMQLSMMERTFHQESQSGKQAIKPSPKGKNVAYKSFLFNNLVDELAIKYGIRGHRLLIPTGCAGGLDAIGYSMLAIRNGKCDLALTGASEAPLTPLVMAAFNKIGVLVNKYNHSPNRASRPFDRDRDGFVIGEGCGVLVLESYQHAKARNAKILAELSGFGSVNNHTHMTDIPEDGMDIAKSALLAIKDADIKPAMIDFINSHGSSTKQNDLAETRAYNYIFGNDVTKIPVTSIKSLIGHSFAASNVIEVISSILSIIHNMITPTINLENQDPLCNLNVVGNEARSHSVNCVLKTSSGFSGIHSGLVIKRFTE